MIKKMLLICVLVPGVSAALSATAEAQHQPSYSCPDDGESQAASNQAGTSDKVCTLTPTGTNNDKDFKVEVWSTTVSDGVVTKVTLLDWVQYTDGSTPPVTVPPGARAYVVDTQDGNQAEPHGAVSFV